MNVLSLFDGMSCGQQALERCGFFVDNYFASEIDKHAIAVTMANYPNTKQLGSVVDVDGYKLPKIDLLIGGSPCQSFSFAGKRKGMSTKCETEILTLEHYLELKAEGYEFEGQSYLFWEYMRLLNEVKPKYFLLENVMMGEKWEKILSKAIGVNAIEINSALVSAQNRRRLYWTNIGMEPGGLFGDLQSIIQQPKDKGILLKDILESEVDEKYFLSDKMIDCLKNHQRFNKYTTENLNSESKSSCLSARLHKMGNADTYIKIDKAGNVKANQDKASCFTAGGNSGGNHSDMDLIVHNTMPRSSKTGKGGTGPLSREDGKTYCLDTGSTNAVEIFPADYRSDEGIRIRKNGKAPTLTRGAESSGTQYNSLAVIESRIRRLTPLECERLQTVKDNEISCIFALCLEKAKNYVNVVSQNPKLLKLVLDAENSELNELVKNALLNMSVSHQSIKHTVPQNADMQIRKETNQCTNHNQQESNTNANNAELNVMSRCQKEWVDFAQPNVFINIIEGRITHFGQEELHQKDSHFTKQLNGSMPLKLFGNEIMELVKGAIAETTKTKDTNFTYTTLYRSNTKSLEQMLIIYYLFAKRVITGYTQNIIQTSNLLLKFNLNDGYTSVASDTQRYRMLGNGWTIDVIAHIFGFVQAEIHPDAQ